MLTLKKSTTKVSNWLAAIPPARFFLVTASVFGVGFLLLTPAFQVPDEQAHFFRAYQVSEGRMTSEYVPRGVGGQLPEALLTSANRLVGDLPGHSDHKVNRQVVREEWQRRIDHNHRTGVHFENTALYSPLLYAPSALGMRVVDGLASVSPVMLLYVGRLCTLVAWIGLMYVAIRLIPTAKWLLVVLGLAPTALFQAASVSADALTVGFGFVVAAWFVRLLLQANSITRKQWLVTVLLVTCLGLLKQPYALLGLLFVCLPAARFVSSKQRWLFITTVGGALLVSLLAWSVVAQALYTQSPFLVDRVIAPDQQLQFMLHHPLAYGHAEVLTHVTESSDGLIRGAVGIFGWLDTLLPLWAVLAYLGCVVLALTPTAGERQLSARYRWLFAAVVIALCMAIDALLYMYWNTVGAPHIEGLQGRYYIPLAPLAALALFGLVRTKIVRWPLPAIIMPALWIILPFSLYVLSIRFY